MGFGLITVGSRDPGTWNTRTLPWKGSGDDMCPDPAWCDPVHATFLFPGQVETWYSQAAYYDVSMRDGPDVRPLGHAAPAFIVERMHCLTTPLTGDVPLQHLMCPVHSAGRQRPGRLAGGVPVRSAGRQCAHAAACTMLIKTRTWPGKLPLHANTTRAADIRAQGDCTGD